jgi:hypothetical protein
MPAATVGMSATMTSSISNEVVSFAKIWGAADTANL